MKSKIKEVIFMLNEEVIAFLIEKYAEKVIELGEGIGLINIVLEDILSDLT